jgi:hypothetical protein
VESADLRLFRDGSGDIPLLLVGETRVGYVTLWPHARPWRTRRRAGSDGFRHRAGRDRD